MTATQQASVRCVERLGARLLAVRRMENLSQSEMALKLGVSQRSYIHYEKGTREPGASLLLAVSRSFGVDLQWLLEGSNPLPMHRGGLKCEMDVMSLALEGIISTCRELPAFPEPSKIAEALVAYYQGLVETGYGSDKTAHDRRRSLLAAQSTG